MLLQENELERSDDARHGFREPIGAFAELVKDYQRIGFDSGYSQAVRDQLESLVAIAERFLAEMDGRVSAGVPDRRRLIYSFVARLERRLGALASQTMTRDEGGGFVEGGLGI